MNPFQFRTVPTQVVEFGAARRLGALLRERFPALVRLCVVTDAFLHRSGVLAPALESLAAHGWQVTTRSPGSTRYRKAAGPPPG